MLYSRFVYWWCDICFLCIEIYRVVRIGCMLMISVVMFVGMFSLIVVYIFVRQFYCISKLVIVMWLIVVQLVLFVLVWCGSGMCVSYISGSKYISMLMKWKNRNVIGLVYGILYLVMIKFVFQISMNSQGMVMINRELCVEVGVMEDVGVMWKVEESLMWWQFCCELFNVVCVGQLV